jgi:hypothetical protein
MRPKTRSNSGHEAGLPGCSDIALSTGATGKSAALQASNPPSTIMASMPISARNPRTAWLTSCPCTQYTTTRPPLNSSAQFTAVKGWRHTEPGIAHPDASRAAGLRTSMITHAPGELTRATGDKEV